MEDGISVGADLGLATTRRSALLRSSPTLWDLVVISYRFQHSYSHSSFINILEYITNLLELDNVSAYFTSILSR
jgi:hypothetical protein